MSRTIIWMISFALVGPTFGQPCVPVWSREFSNGPQGAVDALAEFDEDGPGPRGPVLFAGGTFTAMANGAAARRLVRYDGQAWSQVGNGLNGVGVFDLAVLDEDDENPPSLIVGGNFSVAIGGASYAGPVRWDGVQFTRLGTGVTGQVSSLDVCDDDGPGPHLPALYVTGNLRMDGQLVHGVLKWDGVAWSVLPFPDTWLDRSWELIGGGVVAFDPDGDGPEPMQLYLGAAIVDPDTGGGGVARWTGETWEIVGGGLESTSGPPTTPFITSLRVFDEDADGPTPPALFVSGQFILPGYPAPRQIAKWSGVSWEGVAVFGDLDPFVFNLAAFDEDGGGPQPARLYASGSDSHFLTRWDGTSWTAVASVNGPGWASPLLATQRNGEPALYVGGGFHEINGITAWNVAKLIGCPRSCPGDLTGDGQVDLDDLTMLLAHFGAMAATPEQGDLNDDGDIDVRDLTGFLSAFGESCL